MSINKAKDALGTESIAIAMPAFNEEGNIEHVVRSAFKVLSSLTDSHEVLVVNDGSTDRTRDILEELKKEFSKLKVIHHETNKGIGVSNFDIYMNITSTYLFWNAADNQIYMEELYTLLPHIMSCDIVVGNRQQRSDNAIRKVMSASFNLAFRLRFGIPIRDVDSIKMFRMSIFKDMKLNSRSSYIESEILVKAKKANRRITEVPIEHHPRVRGEAQGFRLRIITPQLVDFARSFFGLL